MEKARLLVFASGTKEGGGSGFDKLVLASKSGVLCADVVGVVSNHADGGVRKRAHALGVPFVHFPGPWTAEEYQRIARESGANFFALSGWLKLVRGLDLATDFSPRTVTNIHPGPPERFGGAGMYGHHVHEAVIAAYRRGEITHTEVCMHFVTHEFDRGPVFLRGRLRIRDDDTPESLGARVNHAEHRYQSWTTSMVVRGAISWDGVNPVSLKVPPLYQIEFDV